SAAVTLDSTAPGTGGAPDVSGAGNARTRTVTFDRDPTATTATIEVLDGGGSVVASTGVLVGGSGDVTLPDADGSYLVRVRQSDLLGNTTTSATAPTTLDRVAPDAGGAPTVSGSLRSRQRDVTFVRALDAASASVEVRDGRGAVVLAQAVPSGDAAAISLPDADGDYAVRVVQTDAAGNAASSPAAGAALDRVPPDAGAAPRLSGTPDALVVDFDRDPSAVDATIQIVAPGGGVLGGVDVPSGGNALIVLPAAAGDYAVRVVQTDAAGNSATSPSATATRPSTPVEPPAPGPPAPTPPRNGPDSTPGGGSSGGSGPALTDPARFGALLTQCYGTGDVAVTDATRVGRRVVVQGLTRYAPGTAVAIVDQRGRTVGHATADAHGRFVAFATPPSARLAPHTLYRAVVGATRSGLLRLQRGNAIRSVAVRGATVTIRGRVDVRALGRRVRVTVLGGRGGTACRSPRALRRVGALRLNPRTGAYVVRAQMPSGSGTLAVSTKAAGKRVSHSAYALR
ncbi:MAG TPA: hypothetical protein VFV85_00160, partial [Conexibacter sp.]|nr:hypothetical protein [Conexibacter sp.]